MVKAGGEVGAGNRAAAKGSAQPALHQAVPIYSLYLYLSLCLYPISIVQYLLSESSQ